MDKYVSPNAEFIEFSNGRIDTAGSKCNCYAENWDFDEHDLDDPTSASNCKLITRDFYEVADANVL